LNGRAGAGPNPDADTPGLCDIGRMRAGTLRAFLFYPLLAASYVATGRLGLLLAVPPGYATAIFPPAGIAAAAMLVAGPASLPWTFLGR
jgi:hypothetical protein